MNKQKRTTQDKPCCAYPGCERDPQMNGRCIFHAKAEEKGQHPFNQALREYVGEIADKAQRHDFSGFIFPGNIDFRKDHDINVFTKADFRYAIFKGETRFVDVTFNGETSFGHAIFEGKASFNSAIFKGEASFGHAIFGEETLFQETTFGRDAWLRSILFKKEAQFWNATFKGEAWFGNTIFNARAWFRSATFRREAGFSHTTFEGEASFQDATFKGVVWFDEARFREYALISPKYIEGEISFKHALIENISLSPLRLKENVQIDFAEARIRNTNIRRGDLQNHVKQEDSKDYAGAEDIYLLLKNNFHTIGRYDDESWAFTREKDMKRKSYWYFQEKHKVQELGEKWKDKGMNDCFHPVLFYYECIPEYLRSYWVVGIWQRIRKMISYEHDAGSFRQRLRRARIRMQGKVNEFSSFVKSKKKKEKLSELSSQERLKALWFYLKYPAKHRPPLRYFTSTFLKYLYGWGEWPWLIFVWCFVAVFVCSLIYYFGETVVTSQRIHVTSYLKKLYFSGITFTALGYGDYSPVGWARVLAFFESFLGIFFIALFVFSFARRTGGR